MVWSGLQHARAATARPAAVAGFFYPGAERDLERQVDAYLDAAAAPATPGARPKLLIVPHAGYVYSGAVAGQAYAQLQPHASSVRHVVLLGPTHRVALRGLAAPTVQAFDTPLGRVPLDRAALDALSDLPQVLRDDRAHAQEHSLEVQLPFLQRALGNRFTLVPLAVGDVDAPAVAEVLERLWGGDETLIVLSSDLSHYLPYAEAQAVDRRTVQRILAGATDLVPDEACGAHVLNGALLAARRHGLETRLLDLRNSGDTAGDRQRVVGYAALAASSARDETTRAGSDAADGELGSALLTRARNAIGSRFGLVGMAEPPHARLAAAGATFVTLKDAAGGLRGCIGRLWADTTLDEDVRRNAQAAAFSDPRFAPLTLDEWAGIELEISLIGPHTPLPAAASLRAAAGLLTPGADGVTLEWRGLRSTLLPQVWAELPDPVDFLAALVSKAGLPGGRWPGDLRLSRYAVQRFKAEGS